MKQKLSFLICLFSSINCFGIIDYTIDENPPIDISSNRKRSPRKRAPKKSDSKNVSSKNVDAKSGGLNLEVFAHIKTLKLSTPTNPQFNKLDLGTTFTPSKDFYIDFSHWMASSEYGLSDDHKKKKSYELGNAKVKIGLHWLNFGNSNNSTQIDLYTGSIFSFKKTFLSSSYQKTFFGVETSKKIQQITLAFGTEFYFGNNPQDSEEIGFSSINLTNIGISYVISRDIRFVFEGSIISLGEQKNLKEGERIQSSNSIIVIGPKIYLAISNNTEILLGSILKTSDVSKRDQPLLLRAKLFDFDGFYGNTYFAGLNIYL